MERGRGEGNGGGEGRLAAPKSDEGGGEGVSHNSKLTTFHQPPIANTRPIIPPLPFGRGEGRGEGSVCASRFRGPSALGEIFLAFLASATCRRRQASSKLVKPGQAWSNQGAEPEAEGFVRTSPDTNSVLLGVAFLNAQGIIGRNQSTRANDLSTNSAISAFPHVQHLGLYWCT